MKRKIAVWFSCGAASAAAVIETFKQYPSAEIRVINTPVPEEHPDNQRFLRDIASALGITIEQAVNKNPKTRSCADVWKNNHMSTPKGAKCTQLIKKQTRQQWEKENQGHETVLGFTLDEMSRHEKFELTERKLIPVLIDAGMTKDDCYKAVADLGVKLPEMYRLGYPNANCIGCVKATSPTYWNHVRKVHPAVFDERVRQSDRYGAKLVRVKGERLHLRDLPVDAVGLPLKSMDIECGIFCEEIR